MPVTNPWLAGPAPARRPDRDRLEERILDLLSAQNMSGPATFRPGGPPAGLLIRQAHHWAANVFIAAIIVHVMRIFWTGAFRKPRELNWMIGVTMLMLAILEGFAGYSLPDDLLSGMGLVIAYGVVLSIPLAGGQIANLVWDGRFPGSEAFWPRLFIAHVFVIPLVLAALAAATVLSNQVSPLEVTEIAPIALFAPEPIAPVKLTAPLPELTVNARTVAVALSSVEPILTALFVVVSVTSAPSVTASL